jgi:predicted transcriptional regulator YdeE
MKENTMKRDEAMALVWLHRTSTNDQEKQEIETRIQELWQKELDSYAEITALSVEHTEKESRIVYSVCLEGKTNSIVINV